MSRTATGGGFFSGPDSGSVVLAVCWFGYVDLELWWWLWWVLWRFAAAGLWVEAFLRRRHMSVLLS
jgi:hypothetical protein